MIIYSAQFAPAASNFTDLFDRGVKVTDKYGKARESFTEDAFARQRRPVPVLLSHVDDPVVGEVVARTVFKGWHLCDFTLDERYADMAKVGTPVSISFVPDRVETPWEGIRLHTRALLREISLLRPDEQPAYPGAKVTGILRPREAAVKVASDVPKVQATQVRVPSPAARPLRSPSSNRETSYENLLADGVPADVLDGLTEGWHVREAEVAAGKGRIYRSGIGRVIGVR